MKVDIRLNLKTLPNWDLRRGQGIGRKPYKKGIYIIPDPETEEILYIGKTKNVTQRLQSSHHPIRLHFPEKQLRVYFLAEDSESVRSSLENALICVFRPKLNSPKTYPTQEKIIKVIQHLEKHLALTWLDTSRELPRPLAV